jgi:hypothetical protein
MRARRGARYEKAGRTVKVTKVQRRSSLSLERTVWYRVIQHDGEVGSKVHSQLEPTFLADAIPATIVISEAAQIDAAHEEVAAAKAEAAELRADASCTKCGERYASQGFSYQECPECHRQRYSFRGDGVVNSIGRPAAKDACRFIGEPWTPEQEEAYEDHVSSFLKDYRAAQARRSPEELEEERAEMRAAFGPGQEVVNIITGRRTRT